MTARLMLPHVMQCRLHEQHPWVSMRRLQTLTGGLSGFLAVLQLTYAYRLRARDSDLMDGLAVELVDN